MTKFVVPIRIEFDGTVLVESNSEEDAAKIAVLHITAGLDTANVNWSDKSIRNVTWNPNGYVAIRDNESVEEYEEEEI